MKFTTRPKFKTFVPLLTHLTLNITYAGLMIRSYEIYFRILMTIKFLPWLYCILLIHGYIWGEA